MADFTYITAELAAKSFVAQGFGEAHVCEHTISGKPAVRYMDQRQGLTNGKWIESDVLGVPV